MDTFFVQYSADDGQCQQGLLILQIMIDSSPEVSGIIRGKKLNYVLSESFEFLRKFVGVWTGLII